MIARCASYAYTDSLSFIFLLDDCLSGLVIEINYSDGTSADMVFGSNPTSYYTTEGQIVGFHGIAGENCIKRLGVYTQMDSSELRGEHVKGINCAHFLIIVHDRDQS